MAIEEHRSVFWFAVLLLGTAATLDFYIGVLALRRFPKSRLHFFYFLTTFFPGMWSLLNLIWLLSPEYQTVFIDRLTATCFPLGTASFVFFAMLAPRHGARKISPYLAIVVTAAVISVGVAFSPWLITGLKDGGGFALDTEFGPAFWPFIVPWLLAFLAGNIVLFRKMRRATDPFDKVRLKLLFIAGVIPPLTAPPMFIIPYLLDRTGTLNVIPDLVPCTSVLSMLINAYAIMRYQLFDIRLLWRSAMVVIAQSIIHIAIVGSLVALTLMSILKGFLSADFIMLLVFAFAAALLSPSIGAVLSRLADRMFFAREKEREARVREFTRSALRARSVDTLARGVCDFLRDEFNASAAMVFFFDVWHRPTQAVLLSVPDSFRFDVPGDFRAALNDFAQKSPHVVSRYGLEVEGAQHPLHRFLPLFIEAGVEIFIPFETVGNSSGGIFIGRQKGGATYSGEAIRLIELLADSVAPALLTACIDERIEESHRRYQGLFERAGDALFLVSGGDKTIREANTTAEKMFRCSRAELIGMPLSVLTAQEYHSALDSISTADGCCAIPEITMQRRCGERFPGEVYSAALEDGTVVLNVREITERKRTEHELLMMRKIESLGVLAGGVAHDFGNIIASILGSAEVAIMSMDPGDKNAERLQRIVKASRRARDITLKLLSFARKEKLNVQHASLNNIVREVVEMIADDCPNRIETRLDPALKKIKIDVTQIYQTVFNVVLNACDAAGERGLVIIETFHVVFPRPATHETAAASSGAVPAPGEYCAVRVTDDGPGIPAEILPKIFEPFFTTKEQGKGTGLGLSVALGIVNGHNGLIEIHNAEGGGTAVTIFLPVETQGDENSRDITDAPRLGKTILVIDDDPDFALMAKEALEAEGYAALKAIGGREAIDIIASRKHDIDAVLLDMVMPDMDGTDTFNAIRAMSENIKIVICSGFSMDGRASALLERGACEFLQKPFTVSGLAKTMSAIFTSD